MKAKTYRELIGHARKQVIEKKYKPAAKTFVSPIYAALAHRVNSNLKNVYLAGVSRIGKTRLADLLSQHGYLVISMDEVREFYWGSSTAYQEVDDIDACRNAVYQVLHDYFPAGVCIEGSDVYFHALNRRQPLPGDHILFALGIRPTAIVPKAISMYKAAKNGHCRGLMTYQEAERIATVQSKLLDGLTGTDLERIHYLDMMRYIDSERSLKAAEQEVLTLLGMQCKIGEQVQNDEKSLNMLKNQTKFVPIDNLVSEKNMNEESYEARLSVITARHEKESNDLLLRLETLLKENERLKSMLGETTFSEKSTVAEQSMVFDFSLPERKL